MKVKEIIELNSKFDFEAPVFKASSKLKNKLSEQITKDTLDLNKMLAPKPEDIYLVRVGGESMIDKKIYDGDVLIVDKNAKPKIDDIVISSLNGEMTVKTFKKENGRAYLVSANSQFFPIEISPLFQFKIQGVVKHVIRIA
ncbi:S24 family peptidase [Candidatus Kapabacteria bacterium]|nr:S24 family peptidase [Candidatus Kapabacteria bacterium]